MEVDGTIERRVVNTATFKSPALNAGKEYFKW